MKNLPEVDHERIAAAVKEILAAIGEDPDRDGLQDTPDRVARMYAEICGGLREDPTTHLDKTFQVEHDEIIVVRDIPFYSICEHHLIPFFGKAHVAYLPKSDGRITGLSKLARLVDGYAKRPQVQEKAHREKSPMPFRKNSFPAEPPSFWKRSIFACRCGESKSRAPAP